MSIPENAIFPHESKVAECRTWTKEDKSKLLEEISSLENDVYTIKYNIETEKTHQLHLKQVLETYQKCCKDIKNNFIASKGSF